MIFRTKLTNEPRGHMRFLLLIISGLVMARASFAQEYRYEALGWDPQNKHWAFLFEGDDGDSMALMPIVEFKIVDVESDKITKIEKRESKGEYESEDQNVSFSSVVKEWRKGPLKSWAEFLKGAQAKPGTVVLNKPLFNFAKNKANGLKSISFKSPNGRTFEVRLRPEFKEDSQACTFTASRLVLEMRENGKPWKTLHSDKKFSRDETSYGISFLTIAPNGKHAALLVEAARSGAEGCHTTRLLSWGLQL